MASFIIGFTLYESSKRYDARAESFLRCATELQKIRDEAQTVFSIGTTTIAEIKQFETAYHKILADYTDNHAVLDYRAHQISTGKIVGPRAIAIHIIILANIWLLPIIAIASPLALFFI